MGELVFVAGTRPNFMKIAPILRAVRARANPVPATLVHTGQHYDAVMSEVFFEQLGIGEPDVHLDVGSGLHGAQTARIIERFEAWLIARNQPPRAVVVVGDVNSTMACALVAVKLGIPVAHVEAGLRSHDRTMPEEINRLITDTLADLLLVSEPDGTRNLAAEGIAGDKIRYVGNVMIDSLAHKLPDARALAMPRKLGVRNRYALVTLHRPSNVDHRERLTDLVTFLLELSTQLSVVFPVHPRTDKQLRAFGLRGRLVDGGVSLFEPVGYEENLSLMHGATMVVTDSGGIQEETTYLGVPCITLRPNTERPITVTSGTNTVTEALEPARAAIAEILAGRYKSADSIDGWDGHAAERIVDALLDMWPEPSSTS